MGAGVEAKSRVGQVGSKMRCWHQSGTVTLARANTSLEFRSKVAAGDVNST